MQVRKLDENLWMIRSHRAWRYLPCCFESKEAALCALNLTIEDRVEMQKNIGDGVITYYEVLQAVSRRRGRALALRIETDLTAAP